MREEIFFFFSFFVLSAHLAFTVAEAANPSKSSILGDVSTPLWTVSTASEMEDSSLPAQVPPLPTSADQRSAELPSPTFTPDPSPRGRKRALEANLQIENSNYYKMRLLLKDLRPHVLEVLRTSDFRNCKAAIEIQEKMKLMLQLYREMIGESPKRKKTAKNESLSNGKAINETPQSTATTSSTRLRSSETSYVQTEKQNTHGDGDKVVGGSAFGWNFITRRGTDPVYCGMSKGRHFS